MVLQNRFPPDIRVEKEARALINEGYRIYLLTEESKGSGKEEMVNGIYVRRVLIKKKGNFLGKIDTLWLLLTFQHRVWEREIEKFVRDFKIEVLHIHDLPLLKVGIKIAKNKDIPIVADLHENYPVMLEIYHHTKGIKDKIFNFFFRPKRWQVNERKCLEEADRVIVVVDEAKERIINYRISKDKIFVVSNMVDIEYFNSVKIDEEIINRYQEKFVISYLGKFGPDRGIDVIIKAMKYLQIRNVKLLFVGTGNQNYEEYLKNLAVTCKIEKSVEFAGWQPFSKVPSYIEASDICLIPHKKNPHTDATIPHKLFQYMLMGKPVIVSNCQPLKRVVEETNSGLVFEAGDEKDLADKVIALYRDRNLRENLGKNGRDAVLKRYNWQRESEKLLDLYKGLSN